MKFQLGEMVLFNGSIGKIVSYYGDSIVVRYDDGDEFALPYDELKLAHEKDFWKVEMVKNVRLLILEYSNLWENEFELIKTVPTSTGMVDLFE